jgi:hypothetical protein
MAQPSQSQIIPQGGAATNSLTERVSPDNLQFIAVFSPSIGNYRD